MPLSNAGGEQFGDIDMRTALTHSVNTVLRPARRVRRRRDAARVHGPLRLRPEPAVQLPDDQKAASGIFVGEQASSRSTRASTSPASRSGRAAGGDARYADGRGRGDDRQRRQADEADAGQKIVDPDGRVTDELDPEVQSDVVSEETAAELADMMTSVVDEGTARAAAISAGRRRRQDRHGRDQHRAGHRAALVHRLRPGRGPADRDRRHHRARRLLRRHGRRPDRDVRQRGLLERR